MMESYLPEMIGMARGIRGGRSVYEGYQRGWGLEFGGLREKVLQDPLYNEALRYCHGRTILAEYNRMNIFLIIRFFLSRIPFGHIIEFGSYRGGNAIFMAYVAAKLYPGIEVYALDSFKGMPAPDKSVDAHTEGDFGNVDLNELRQFVRNAGITNLMLVEGRFEDTAKGILQGAQRIALAHIDCDIYPSVKYSYEVVKPHMVAGGYIVLDDATSPSCIGATEAVESLIIRRDGMNSEQVFPHFVFRALWGRRKWANRWFRLTGRLGFAHE
jgi:predicted O-methyltransferase YrrM